MRFPWGRRRIYSAGDPEPKKNSRFDELMPPKEATLKQLEYASNQKAIWDREVVRIQGHLAAIDAYDRAHDGGIAPDPTPA